MVMALSEAELQAFSRFEMNGWDRAADPYHHHWGNLSRQSAEPMLDAARVKKRSTVLDIATGAGYIAAAALIRGANVIGLDFSEAQVELARSTYPLVEFRQGDAEALSFDEGTFDAVVIGFGINHLPHPERAFAEGYRVLRPGGYFAFTVWATPNPGEAFGIVLGAIQQHGEPNAKLPPAPPYFRFADSEEVRRVFEQTGFVEPGTQLVPQFWQHDTPDQVFDAFNEGAVRATAMLRSQSAQIRDKIRTVVRTHVERLRQNDKYVVPVPAALSWARKP
jgi:ubiquinone/menaquinone biosynthesis C-methylase UbiE